MPAADLLQDCYKKIRVKIIKNTKFRAPRTGYLYRVCTFRVQKASVNKMLALKNEF
jgi:hypothetical protein